MNNQQLVYDLENDGQIYLKTNLKFANHNLSVKACTIAGTKDGITPRKNEDAFSLAIKGNNFFACVFDGNSSLKPIKDLGELSGARYASHYLSPVFNSDMNLDNWIKENI